ncbi:SDR family oxidoreductase [candidate division WOR-3 bacterium]|nr:SDR family oxidoreductase [candidate division WOR-3 bacterium]
MNNVFVITGTSKGIGRYLAEYYLEKGKTVAGCSRGESDLKHGRYSHFNLDVSDEGAVVKMIRAVSKDSGGIDVLINNAGIASMNHFIMTPLASMEKIYRTNVLGTFVFARESSKIMMRKKYGRIINFATVATPLRLEGEMAYASSKSSVESMTEIMAKELAPFNITCNAVGPTPVYTDLIKNVPKSKMDSLIGRQTIQRLGEFKDISNVIDFFIRPESDFITGQVIYLGGVR